MTSSRRGGGWARRLTVAIDRLEGDWPTRRLVHRPVHASWLHQVEIDLSISQRKVLIPNDVADLVQVEHRLLAFQCC